MKAGKYSIVEYKPSDAPKLLGLLLELHDIYFHKNASRRIRELAEEKDIKKSYKDYINRINKSNTDTWKIYLAVIPENKIIGFIIGSISEDKSLLLNKTGKIEDWFVAAEYRRKGAGIKLYLELEKWFIQKGCQQVSSDTWFGNKLSIISHKKSGFFVSGISFGKVLG